LENIEKNIQANMATIIIKNVGPIKEARLGLSKVNVFMGPQSSGKSTIAKLISYCQWVEKRRLLDNKFEYDVWQQLVYFHRLDESYFQENSSFEYTSDFISVSYRGKDLKENIVANNAKIAEYRRTKNIYITSERNFVSVIPNLQRYRERYDNIFELLSDWSTAKSSFAKKNSFSILNFGVSYYFDEEEKKDMLALHKEQKEIPFSASSSGLQSVAPLVVILEYLTSCLYQNFDADRYRPNPMEYKSFIDLYYKVNPETIQDDGKFTLEPGDDGMMELFKNRMLYHSTNFIIEEPEQNLFPETQRDLVYYILEKLQSERTHSMTITTHSPYILYALNNCMLGGFIDEKMGAADKERLKCKNSFINPKNVAAYEVHDGVLKSIQQDDGLIGANYFDAKMKELMDDFYIMLNYYGE
jgi:hypothetical protein